MRLKELREEREMTQQNVADGIHTSQRNIGRWENNDVLPSSDFIIKLADFFGVSADYLLERTDDFGVVTTPSDVTALTYEEKRLLQNFRSMRVDLRAYFLEMSETFIHTSNDLIQQEKNKKKKV